MIGDGISGPQTTLNVYDIATNSWSTGNPAPAGVFLSGYQTVGNYLYIVGGFTDNPAANSTATMRLDMSTGTPSSGPAFTPQRADFALASAGTKLYAIGGDTSGGSYFDSTALVNELDTASWPGGSWIASTAQPAGTAAPGEPGRLQLDRPCRRRDLVDGRHQRRHLPVPERPSLPGDLRRATTASTSAAATTTSATRRHRA